MKIPEPRLLKSGNYFIQLRLNGESIPITAETKTECKKIAELTKAEYRNEINKPKATRSKLTLGELIDAYIENRSKVLSPSTINGYKTIRKNRFQTYINKKPSAIKDWQAVIDAETEDDVSPKTIKNSWALVESALKYHKLYVPEVKLPTIVQSTRPWLDAEQIKVFIKAVNGKPCEIPALLALHSLRRSEILGLTWDKIDLKAKTIRIEGSAVVGEDNKLVYKKTNKSKNSRRTVPIMIPELETALAAVPESKRKGKIYTKTPTLIWEQVNNICRKNNLPEVGVHGLRHSFASLAHHVGLPEQEAMLIGGWEDAQTMHKIYEHISNADKLKAENKISEFFKNANKNANKTSNSKQTKPK